MTDDENRRPTRINGRNSGRRKRTNWSVREVIMLRRVSTTLKGQQHVTVFFVALSKFGNLGTIANRLIDVITIALYYIVYIDCTISDINLSSELYFIHTCIYKYVCVCMCCRAHRTRRDFQLFSFKGFFFAIASLQWYRNAPSP